MEGEDIDTLDVPGVHATNVLLLDLSRLDSVLGAETITRLFLVDADDVGTINPIEVLSLNALFGSLGLSPASGFATSGPQGGPFAPASATWSVTNTGDASIDWTASAGVNYISASPSAGHLVPGASTSITVATNAATSLLGPGTYHPTLTVTNTTNGSGTTTRPISVTVTGGAPCPADVNGDQQVNLTDLAIILTNFGTPGGASHADGDVDGDGDVDLADLATLLAAFGSPC